jgi:methyl-accepting chemotaxis protein
MPLWSRIAISTFLLVVAAAGVTSTLQAIAARRAILEQARAGAHGVAEVLAKATTFAEEGPPTVDAEAGEQTRRDTTLSLRRLVSEVAAGDIREVRILDAYSSPLVTRVIDENGNPADSAPPLDQADAGLVKESIATGRSAGRVEGAIVRVAAPVLRADGGRGGAVLVAVATRAGRDLWSWELLAGALASVLVGLPGILLARWLARSTTDSVRVSTAIAESIATGDISGIVPPGGNDEAGQLLAGVGRMSAALRETIGRLQSAGARVTEVESDVSVALARQERIVRGFSGSVADVSGAASQISSNAEQLLGATGAVTVAAREAARVADDGRHGLERMSESMRQLDEVMTAFTRKLAMIRQRAGGINAVVTTIAKVADQTNLLSVNATIEAEKAGEAGRGFRIVAQEIRRLADQTALATKDIERMVRDMQSAVSSGTMEMDRFRNEVSTRIQQVTDVSRQLAGIVAPVQSVTQALDHVHDGMENQNAGARQIRDSLDRLRVGAGQSASAVEAFVTAMNQLRASVGELNDELVRLRIDPTGAPD